MKQKQILVDLTKLKVLNCGLGQVAYNSGIEIGRFSLPELKMNLLLPSAFIGEFGDNVGYIKAYLIHKYLPLLIRNFDLWHSTSQLSGIVPFSKKKPMLLTIHDLNFLYEKRPEKAKNYLRKVQKRVDRACFITTISEFTASEIRQHLDLKGKELRVIHNGVQLLNGEESNRPDFVSEECPFFFTIGQIVEKKNFHTLLDTMKILNEYTLYISGEDKSDYADSIRKRINDENINNVVLTGTISPLEKNWLYQNCRAFLFPSKFEGFGLPVIEAMQCGKPVFSSNMTSLKEIGDKYAYFWENFEPEYMANIINKGLLDFDSNPQLQTDEIEYAMSFSYEKNVKAYLDLYREILGV
ncbi:MAG: glycosyltransferase family 4 protein [Bacteroidales bacterium]